jgi:hypothetical protein
MEQLDAVLIKLSNSVTDKASIRKLIRTSHARDFKISSHHQEAAEQENDGPQNQGGAPSSGNKKSKKSRNE